MLDDLTGLKLGPYTITRFIGEGGMAAVYEAHQENMDRDVALKILPRGLANDPQFVERFQREARLLAQLQHPHILPVFDFGSLDGYTYIAMPLVKTGTLAEVMKRAPLSLKQVRTIVSQLGDALDYAHSRGLVHRDVKPSNVLVDERGNCTLTDFGIAKLVEGTGKITHTGGIVGTPAYMSPEQGLGKKLDGRSDIYSLGIILHELVTGRAPYEAETPIALVLKHVSEPLPNPRSVNPNLPIALERVIIKALAKAPEDRYATAGELVDDLEHAIPSDTLSGTSAPTMILPAETGTRPTPSRRMSWPLALGGLVGVAAVVGGLFFWGGGALAPAATPTSESPTLTPPIATVTLEPSPTPPPPTATTLPPTTTALPTETPMPTPTRPPALGIGSTRVAAVDGMVQVYVPEGEFLMGSSEADTNASKFERPQRSVFVDAFWADQTEVTNAMYVQCVDAGGCLIPIGSTSATRLEYFRNPAYNNYPVLYVSWANARAYCEWAGRRLLTEAEWEKAARGPDGPLFPWGDAVPNPSRTNFNNTKGDTTAVGSYPNNASVYGALDMSGNVWEWVSDWYGGGYYATAPAINPQGPEAGVSRVLRGGAWDSALKDIRAAARLAFGPTSRQNFIGFRCGE